MSGYRAILAPIAIAVNGCTVPAARGPVDSMPASLPIVASETTPRKNIPAPAHQPGTETDSIKLQAFEVREAAFSDFGMSVKTNLEVKWGGDVEWMQVSGVATASSASSAGLVAGDRILAIDGRSVTEMNRDGMLDTLFARKKGEAARVLVLGRNQALPHFVRLVASPPNRDRPS